MSLHHRIKPVVAGLSGLCCLGLMLTLLTEMIKAQGGYVTIRNPVNESRASDGAQRYRAVAGGAEYAHLGFPPISLVPMWMYVTTTAYPQNLTSQERDRAVAELKRSRKDFLDSIAGLSQAQWSFKPSIFRWSVGECAEHIAAAEDSYFDLIMKLMQSPAMPEKKGEVAGKDDFVLREMVDRTSKRFAPESLRPNRRWSGPQDIIDHFNRSRDRLIRYVETTNDDMRAHVLPHRAVGPIDAYQWILLASGHTARHTLQIQEVKADRRFPRAPEGQSP